MAKILIIEDDRELAKSLITWLEHQHHTVEHCERGLDALERLRFFEFDVIVLDWNLPEMDGPSILAEFRKTGADTPVLFLTGRDNISEIETGFNTGADDYVTKPCDVRVLSAKINAAMRRQTKQYAPAICFRGLKIDLANHQVWKDEVEVHLPPLELALLEFLVRNPNNVFTTAELMQRVWSSDSEASPDTVRACINRLRLKIDSPDAPSLIRNIPKVGYQIDMGGDKTEANSSASEADA